MKTYLTATAILLLATFLSCQKNCEEKPAACSESPATNGMTCQAYFQSWIYNSKTNDCEFVGYSGCGMVGFETEAECEACECSE